MNNDIISSKISEIENHNNETLDDITRDEISYDEKAASIMLEYIYNETIHIPEFKLLYEKAAAIMFSTDDTIGQAVLFSYDYFSCYHACLVEFFSQRFSTDFDKYRELIKQI